MSSHDPRLRRSLVGQMLTVHKGDDAGREVTVYRGTVAALDGQRIAVATQWDRATADMGLFAFQNGDHLLETYYFSRWWNAYELRSAAGRLRGWYCNIARPARLQGHDMYWDDLALDLLVSPTGEVWVRDEDEYAELHLDDCDPQAHAAVLGAVAEIRALVARGDPPFDSLNGRKPEGLLPGSGD